MLFKTDESTEDIVERGRKVRESLPEKRQGNDYFLMIKRGLVRNPEYRKLMKGPGTIYEYVWCNIVRDKMYNDIHNIKEKYYDKGFLAYCSTYGHIGKECFMHKDTVMGYIKNFEEAGVMETKKIGPKSTKKDKHDRLIDRRSTVFILGTWQKEFSKVKNEMEIKERYYIEDKFYK